MRCGSIFAQCLQTLQFYRSAIFNVLQSCNDCIFPSIAYCGALSESRSMVRLGLTFLPAFCQLETTLVSYVMVNY